MALTTTRSIPMPRNGSATSSQPDTSRPATLTSDQSSMFEPTICEATRNVISSPVSADGPMRSDSLVGPMTDLFGQAHAPASRSRSPARARRPMTSATYGLRGYLSSPSAALQQSLESRLKRQLDGAGSTLFSLIWRAKATPAGRPYCQLVASALRTSGSECGSWPTATAKDAANARNATANRSPGSKHHAGMTLVDTVSLARWPTARAADADKCVRTSEGAAKQRERRKNGADLSSIAHLASWATPNAVDDRGASPGWAIAATRHASGETSTGSPAPTEKRGQLNPAHSRWLMGYPAAWDACAATAMRSSRKSRPRSSRPHTT